MCEELKCFFLHLGELGATRASSLGNAELGKLSLHLLELLEEIILAALAKLVSLDLGYKIEEKRINEKKRRLM